LVCIKYVNKKCFKELRTKRKSKQNENLPLFPSLLLDCIGYPLIPKDDEVTVFPANNHCLLTFSTQNGTVLTVPYVPQIISQHQSASFQHDLQHLAPSLMLTQLFITTSNHFRPTSYLEQ